MKGYISQYSGSGSKSNYDTDIVSVVYLNVLEECFGLVENGYNAYLLDNKKVFSADEITITAGIFGHIETIINKNSLPFYIVPEYPIYSEKIKTGKLNPKKAKRFDLIIAHWNEKNVTTKFGVEAKLLLETDYNSKSVTNLIKEYVEDAGMGKFINKIYDKNAYNCSLMLGHILNGKTENIVQKINDKISTIYSTKERLIKNKKHYISSYLDLETKKRKNLYHIFLDFSALVN